MSDKPTFAETMDRLNSDAVDLVDVIQEYKRTGRNKHVVCKKIAHLERSIEQINRWWGLKIKSYKRNDMELPEWD